MNDRRPLPTSQLVVLVLALAALAFPVPRVLEAEVPASAASQGGPGLESLAWLAGSWSGTVGETEVEEHWTDPSGGRAVMFEFLRIAARGDSIFYIALPRGRGETEFPLKELTGKRVVFENLAHDFPQRIIYWQDEPGELRARTEGTIDGKPVSEEWAWKRAKPAR